MPAALSSLFFIAALAFAMTVGPQTRPWTWGPAMVCLGLALLCGLRCRFRDSLRAPGGFLLVFSLLTVTWIAIRAMGSPVPEMARADLLLLSIAVGAFCWIRTIDGNPAAQRIFHWGVVVLLAANLAVMYYQKKIPGFIPLFHSKPSATALTGFFGHYIEASNFLVATSLWTAGAALFGPHNRVTKTLFLIVSITGLAAVSMTGGRGGVAGGAAGTAAFFTMMLILAKKRQSRWFAPAVVAVPILGAIAVVYLLFGWQAAQKARNIKNAGDLDRLLDNNARLHAIGITWDCISDHPMEGGGSRSVSWEAFRHSDPQQYGNMTEARLEYVHNEFLQAAADYGIIGAVLIVFLLIAFILHSILSTSFRPRDLPPDHGDALILGGFAALAGLITQSWFSFIFHLSPGVFLLGTSLGMIAWRGPCKKPAITRLLPRIALGTPAIASAVILAIFGVPGTVATRILWDSEYSKYRDIHAHNRISNLAEAMHWWKESSIVGQRALLLQKQVGDTPDEHGIQTARSAIADYQEASQLHPFEPIYPVNAGILQSLIGDYELAQISLEKGVSLQAKQEPAFRARFSLATHYLRRGLHELRKQNYEAAVSQLELAVSAIETTAENMHWVTPDVHTLRITIYENSGVALEAAGDEKAAFEAYKTAASFHKGGYNHYRIALLHGKIGRRLWMEREPERALAMFLNAKRSIQEARGELPAGIRSEDRARFTDYLDKSIGFLKGAKVEPAQ